MSSEYTSGLEAGDVSFSDFVMGCAKAALPETRDWSPNRPIPDTFEASPYHTEQLEKATADTDRIKAWSDDFADHQAQLAYDRAVTEYQESLADKEATRTRCEKMLVQVNAWTPPTPEHQGLKDFMIRQLQDYIRFDCSTEYMIIPERLTGQAYKEGQLAAVLKDVAYHTREGEKAAKRAKERTEWVQVLRQSVAELPTS